MAVQTYFLAPVLKAAVAATAAPRRVARFERPATPPSGSQLLRWREATDVSLGYRQLVAIRATLLDVGGLHAATASPAGVRLLPDPHP